MNKRLAEIILILLKYEDFITIDQIAETLNVSNRTIRNDLKSLDSLLPSMGLSLTKKTGMGIILEGSSSDKLKVYDTFKHSKTEQEIHSPIDRHHYILLKLCTLQYYRVFEFVDELFVSRATIHKDLIVIEEYLLKFKLNLERSNTLGISITGKERDIRSMMFDICASTGSSAFASIIKNKEDACSGQFVYRGLDLTDDEINHFISVSRLKYISTFTRLSLESLSQIAIHLLITLIRTQAGNAVQLSDGFKHELNGKPFQCEAHDLLDSLSEGYKVAFDPNEMYYIQIHLLAFQLDKESINMDTIDEFVSSLIATWSEITDLKLNEDYILKTRLLSHMIPVYTRVKHQIPVENDLMHEINQRFKSTYDITHSSIQEIPFWNQMRDEDIGFISLHLEAAIERNKKKLKTLIVHTTSLGARLLLHTKLENNLPDIEIIDEINIAEYNESLAQNYDIIISTVQLAPVDTPTITINNIITDNDITRLKNYIKPLLINKNNPRIRN